MNSTTHSMAPPIAFDEGLVRKYDGYGPRYTSYPTADRFHDQFTATDYVDALTSRTGGAPLSLYVHVPFCESVCYYCGCNKVVTRHHDKALPYLDALERELALQVEVLGRGQALTQLHFGGGTPTFLTDEELARLMRALRDAFTITPGAEVSIEVDLNLGEGSARVWTCDLTYEYVRINGEYRS